ncbi:hypothetical protein FRC14_007765 [Serendipita sp. 396]|nr:hypothetical protein FRC14_007765 [Serendipita sp. 396]KAG8777057.1 hypothetical protein FRC15_011562 [Serendipita sp. 397]
MQRRVNTSCGYLYPHEEPFLERSRSGPPSPPATTSLTKTLHPKLKTSLAMASIPPVEKLPLAARKNIRDEYEAKIGEVMDRISKMLKQTYKAEVNFNQFYAYAVAGDSDWIKNSPGTAALNYIESSVYYLKRLTEEGKDDMAIEAFNDLVSERIFTLEADPKVSYSDCSIRSGKFEFNFNPTNPGVNVDYTCQELEKRLDEALAAKDPEALPVIARRDLQKEFEDKKQDLTSQFKEQLLGADVKLMADYDAIWKTIVAGKKVNSDVDLESCSRRFGSVLKQYFEGFLYYVKNKLNKDDMMVEGFTEAVSTLELWVEVAPEGTKLKDSYYEIEIKDGKFIIRTTPSNYGTNGDYATQNFVDLL